MCTGGEVASVVSLKKVGKALTPKGYSSEDAAGDRERARQEAEAQRIAAEQQAQTTANAALAAKRVRQRSNTLMTRGAGSMATAGGGTTKPALTSTVMARGATTLGGG